VLPDHNTQRKFRGASGPNHNLPEDASALEYFSLFIPLNMFVLWVQYTNAYAAAIMATLNSAARKYQPTTAAELQAWVAAVIWMSVLKSMSVQDFWNPIFDTGKVRYWFPGIARFHQLKRFFKVSDYLGDKVDPSDRLAKVRSLFELFLQRCRQFFLAGVALSLDEAIKKFKGRCIFKQYIKSKPVRWGIKIFCLCCSATGYLLNAYFYLGKCPEGDFEPIADRSETHAQLLGLFEPFQNRYHRVHMDNWSSKVSSIGTLCSGSF
jgi:hypothetical protein